MGWNPEDFASPEVKAEINRLDGRELLALIARADKYLNTGSGEYASEIMRDMADFLRRLAAKADDEDFPMSPSSLVAAWSRYVALFGEPPHGTEEQIRALLRLVPSTTGEPKR